MCDLYHEGPQVHKTLSLEQNGLDERLNNTYNTTMSEPEVKFIKWNKSAVELVGEKLLKLEEEEPETFRRATVVVPTAESGRRLKEWMAKKAERPLLMPKMTLPGQLIKTCGEKVATELETLAAWVEVLTVRTPDAAWTEFFPPPPQENQVQDWLLRTADRLMQLQQQMEQHEVTIDGLLRRIAEREGVDADFAERWEALKGDEERRWEALRELFAAVDKQLEEWNITPAWKARKQWLEELPSSPNHSLLIIACVPELSPQVCRYLRRYPGEVRIWVNAPGDLRARFDEFGCVKPDSWAEEELPAQAINIHVAPSAQGLARAALANVSRNVAQEVVLAACDTSFTPAIVTEFAKHGWQVHLPEGRTFQVSDLAALPKVLADACCAEKLTWADIDPMLRNAALMRLAGGQRFDFYRFGKLVERIRERFIPDSLDMLLQYLNPENDLPGRKREIADIAELRCEEFYRVVQWLKEFMQGCKKNIYNGLRVLESRLRRIYREEMLDHAAGQMAERVKALAGFLRAHPRASQEAWALIKHVLDKQKEFLQDSPREQAHVEALGWRELAFAKGNVIVLTGLHEGCVPEPLPVDPFLPDSLRQLLGMPCNRSREARDCYLLSALLSREKVDISIILSRYAADSTGAPVEPSPLLYHCDIETLVKRVQLLYKELSVEKAADEYAMCSLAPKELRPAEGDMESVAEQLAPRWRNPFAAESYRFSPSQINRFLVCPLRFWMKHALNIDPWEAYEENKADLRAAEYGTLIHAVLEDIGKTYKSPKTLASVDEMYTYAEQRLHAHAEAYYGREHFPLLVKHQILGFCQKCLRPFLEWHYKVIHDEGWECFDCECKVDDFELSLPDGRVVHITMRADRIDHHPASGKWRIIDYKTHERAPKTDHLEVVKEAELWNEKMGAEQFPLIEMLYGNSKSATKPNRWKDVQLPMYAYWLMQNKQCALPEVAYFNMPRTRGADAKYTPMGELDETALESALTWAKSAILLMIEGKCLYSAETFGCKAFGKYSENEDLADPRQLFHTLKPVTLSHAKEPSHE